MRPLNVSTRWMIRRDLGAVLAIDAAAFAVPWCEEQYLERLRERNCIGYVAVIGSRLAGFALCEFHEHDLTILRLAVHPKLRRRGAGRQMIAKLAGKLSPDRRPAMYLWVRETNLAAQKFLARCDLTAVRVERGHFDDTGEDAYVFRRWIGLPSPVAPVGRPAPFVP